METFFAYYDRERNRDRARDGCFEVPNGRTNCEKEGALKNGTAGTHLSNEGEKERLCDASGSRRRAQAEIARAISTPKRFSHREGIISSLSFTEK
jgi:hypothetical protein